MDPRQVLTFTGLLSSETSMFIPSRLFCYHNHDENLLLVDEMSLALEVASEAGWIDGNIVVET